MKKHTKTKQIAYFRRWSRKNYATFSSLNKLITISTIALSCSFLMKPTDGIGQTAKDSLSGNLREIDITAEDPSVVIPLGEPILQVSFSQKEIERVPVHSLSDILEQLQGVDIRQRGPSGSQADISYRGGNFDQTLVLLNGINFTDPQTGHYNLNLPISPEIIKKIELFDNSTSFIFGTAPFSGLINIITKPDTGNHLALNLSAGMYGSLSAGAALNLQTGKVSHLLSADYNRSDGYIHNTDFDLRNAFYQLNGNFKHGELEFQVGYNDKKYGANSFYSLRYPNQYEMTKTFLTSVKWKHNGRIKWSPSIYYRNNRDRFELIKGQPIQKNNYHRSQVMGGNFMLSFLTKAGQTSFSANIRAEDIVSTSLGKQLTNPIASSIDSINYSFRDTRFDLGLAASQQYKYKGLTADISLLLQYLPNNQNKVYLLPGGYVAYQFKNQHHPKNTFQEKLYISATTATRNPTFTDLYYKTGDIIGNNELLPEKAFTMELGFDFNIKKREQKSAYFNAKAAIFHRRGKNMIDYIKLDTEDLWHSVNHTKINFTGIELLAEYKPKNQFGNHFFISNISLQYAYTYSNTESDGYQSRYVLDHLVHSLSLRLSHHIIRNLEVDYAFSYNQRKGEYTSYKQVSSGAVVPYPAYCLLDIRIHYTFRNINFYVEASNVLNQTYFDLGDLVQPGIWVKGGIKAKIGW